MRLGGRSGKGLAFLPALTRWPSKSPNFKDRPLSAHLRLLKSQIINSVANTRCHFRTMVGRACHYATLFSLESSCTLRAYNSVTLCTGIDGSTSAAQAEGQGAGVAVAAGGAHHKTSVGDGTLPYSQQLWTSVSSIFSAILAHPFLQGLADGTLPEETFK